MKNQKNLYKQFIKVLSQEEEKIIKQAMLFFTFNGIYVTLPNSKTTELIKEKAKGYEGLYIN